MQSLPVLWPEHLAVQVQRPLPDLQHNKSNCCHKGRRHWNPWFSGTMVIRQIPAKNRKIRIFLQNIGICLPKPRFSRSPDLAASIGIKISGIRPFPTHFVTKTCFLTYFLKVFLNICYKDGFLATWDPSQMKDLKIPVRMVVLKPLYDGI